MPKTQQELDKELGELLKFLDTPYKSMKCFVNSQNEMYKIVLSGKRHRVPSGEDTYRVVDAFAKQLDLAVSYQDANDYHLCIVHVLHQCMTPLFFKIQAKAFGSITDAVLDKEEILEKAKHVEELVNTYDYIFTKGLKTLQENRKTEDELLDDIIKRADLPSNGFVSYALNTPSN